MGGWESDGNGERVRKQGERGEVWRIGEEEMGRTDRGG